MKIRLSTWIWHAWVLILLTVFFTLSGCATYKTLPSRQGDDCLLLVPVERDEKTLVTNEWGFKYTVYIRELDKQIYIDPNYPFKMQILKPGKYHVTEFRVIRISNGKIENSQSFNLSIEMKAGKITILPFKLTVSWRQGEFDFSYYQHVGFEEVTMSDKRNYAEVLKEYGNYDQWEISYFQ